MARNKTTKKKKRKPNKKKTQKRSVLGFLFKWGFVLGLWALIIVGGVCAYYASELPDITKNVEFERQSSIIVKAQNGTIIGRYGDIIGEQVSVATVPPHLVDAVLAIEDRRFYYHFGLDPLGLARAMFVNVRERRVAQGGSTITQQLAKNLFLSRERTLRRKIQEAMLAIWLEYELSKDEILSAYMNRVYLGAGTYGMDAASKLYFKKPVRAVNVREAAILAGLLKAPSRYSPLSSPSRANKRADVVMAAMVDAGFLDDTEKSRMNARAPKPRRKPSGNAEKYYADWIVDELNDLIGPPGEDLIVETTMNPNVQETAEDSLAATLREHGEERQMSQGAVVVMRPNGAVVALVGGKDYALSEFNRASQAMRQPGSAFKPFVYLTALTLGARRDDLFMDEPIEEGPYRPKNFANEYYGEVTLEEALLRSLNTVAFQLIKTAGPDAVIDTARKLGIEMELDADLSLALGTNEMTPLELTGAYAAIANGGVQVQPYGITRITAADGTLYYERPPQGRAEHAVNPAAVGELIAMMQTVVEHGTGRGAAFGAGVSGKTGTSQDSRDAWFVGFTDRLVTGVWLGNDNNDPMKRVTGGSFPTHIFRRVMAKHNRDYAPGRHDIPLFSGFQGMLSRWGFGSSEPGSGRRAHHQDKRKSSSSVPDSGRYN